MLVTRDESFLLRRCKYCRTEQPETSFEVCRIIKGVVYRRLRCKACKKAIKNKRRRTLRLWLDEYKKTVRCERCGFCDHRALAFHHKGSLAKDFNIADMIGSGLSRAAIKREIDKCVVLCANCHQIEHYDQRK